MRTKVTLVLIFLNVALFFFIFKFERNWRTEHASHEARRRVLGPEIANVQSLTITTGPAPEQSVKLAKRHDGWYLTQPFEWAADPRAVSRIVSDLELLEPVSSFAVRDLAKNNQKLADYGLEQPKLTVTFSATDQSYPKAEARTLGPFVLRIGDKTPDGERVYVLSPDGERVHVVGRSLVDSLLQPIEQLRLNQIFSIPVFEVRSLKLQPSAPANLRIHLRTNGDRWSFEAPIIARASKTRVVLAINALNKLQVKSFVTAPPPNVAPATNPTLRISLEGNNRTETLYLGAPVAPAPGGSDAAGALPDVEYYAKMENKDALFTVVIPGELRRTLDQAQRELRERQLLDFDIRAVTALTLSTPNQPELTLQRLESATPSAAAPWQIARRDPAQGAAIQPADSQVIQRVLEQLALLSAREFLSDAPTRADLENWGLTSPERKITLTLANGLNVAPTVISLEIGVGSDRGKSAYARVGGAEFVYEVDAEILRETPVRALDYRDRLLRELPAGAQISAITLTDLSTKTVIFERVLIPPPPAAAPADEKAAAVERVIPTLLAQLRTLRAKSFVEDQFLPNENVAGESRPWRYQLDTTIALVGGTAGAQTSTTTLLIGERRGGNSQQATSRDFGAVWELEQPLIDALWTLVYGPHDPGPPAPAPVKTD